MTTSTATQTRMRFDPAFSYAFLPHAFVAEFLLAAAYAASSKRKAFSRKLSVAGDQNWSHDFSVPRRYAIVVGEAVGRGPTWNRAAQRKGRVRALDPVSTAQPDGCRGNSRRAPWRMCNPRTRRARWSIEKMTR